MPNDTENTGSSSLLSSITRMLETSLNAGGGFDNIITVLSLLCLFSIMTRNQAHREPQQTQSAATTNPLHKLLGDLTKGGGDSSGFSPESLMSLLPLLNSPQLKSKLNPSTMGTVLGLLNNLGGLGGGSPPPEKSSKAESKNEVHAESPKQPRENEIPIQQPTPTAQPAAAAKQQPLATAGHEETEEQEPKNYGRYLNWKNNF